MSGKHKRMWLESYLDRIIAIAGDDIPTVEQIKEARDHADRATEPYFEPIPDEGDIN